LSRASAAAAAVSESTATASADGAERGGDRLLASRLDPQQRRDGAEHARQLRLEQRLRAVAHQREGERVAARGPGPALALGVALGRLQRPQPLLRTGQGRGGVLVPGVEVLLAGVQAAGLALQLLELDRGPVGPRPGVVERGGEPAELGLRCSGARAQGADLPAQPGEPLAPVGDGAAGGDQRALLGGEGGLGVGPGGDGVVQAGAVVGQLTGQPGLLLADGPGLALEPLGVAARPLLLGQGLGQVAGALRGEDRRAAQPLLQRRQPVPRGRRELERRGLRGRGPLEGVGAVLRRGQLGLRVGAAPAGQLLVPDLGLDRAAQGQQVVGEQPQPGVAQLGLHGGGPPGDLRLPAERGELAAQLDRQVLQPGEVGLHPVELAQRALLALAVLEDAGGLLDEAPPVLGPGGQHRVELPLADDDVQLPADAAVAHQLLDVDQAAAAAVDGVLGRAVAEHQPGDADLGVLDRQGAGVVVDRQRDLGAAERRAAGRAGEDDVLHLAASQGLGPLLAEHPGDGVDDVALARAVRTDHAGDAGLEAQGRRGREGLEALQREALEVHAVALGPGLVRGSVRTRRDSTAPDSTKGASGSGDAPCRAGRGCGGTR
jgi:hypothetical protein